MSLLSFACLQRPERFFSISWLGAGRRKRTTHSNKNNISRYAPKYIRYRITKSACNDLLIGMRPASLITGLGDSVPRTYQVSMSRRKCHPHTIIPVQVVYGFILVRAVCAPARTRKRYVSLQKPTLECYTQTVDGRLRTQCIVCDFDVSYLGKLIGWVDLILL
jgi:hypothetical protein